MYPMNEEPPRSPARTTRGPIIQKETSYVITERICFISPDAETHPADTSITDRIRQHLPIDQARDTVENLREHIHLPRTSIDTFRDSFQFPQLSKDMRRWLPVISSVLLAVLLISLKNHMSPNESALSRHRFSGSSLSNKLSEHGWDYDTVHDRVHNALHDAKAKVKNSFDSHYRHYPDQNWLKAEPEPELTTEERAARLIKEIHDQARRLHIQDPTQVHYEPLSEEEQERLYRSVHGPHHTSHHGLSPKPDNSEALVAVEPAVASDIHNITEYHRAQRLVHMGHDLRTRAESVPHRLMRGVNTIRQQFVDRVEQLHNILMQPQEASVEEEATVDSDKLSSKYHERAEHLIHELEELSQRIVDSEHWRMPVIEKTPWYMKPVEYVTESHPLEWAEDQYNSVVGHVFGVGEDARHKAAEAEEAVRHEAARLQELMKHEVRLLKLSMARMPGQMKRASRSLRSMPMDALEHFA